MAFALSNSGVYLNLNAIKNGKDRFENVPSSLLDNVYLTQTLEWVYQIFMLGLLLIFSLSHAITIYNLKRKLETRIKQSHLDTDENYEYIFRQHAIEESESEPLLAKGKKPSLLTKFNAWSIRSPPSLPILGKPSTSNLQSLFFIFFFAVNLVFLFLGHLPIKETIWVLGYRAGGMIISNLPWLYLVSAKNQPLKYLTGYSYESLNICHRAMGYWICFLALCHVCFMISGFYILSQLGATGDITLGHFLRINIFVFGEVAFGCFLVLFVTSLATVRRRLYEMFLTFHVFFQAVALCFLFFHHPRARIPALISLLIFLVDRILFRLWLKSTTLIAAADISPDGETCSLSADISSRQTKKPAFPFTHSIRAGWHAGQHVFLSIPEIGSKYLWQAHPFSISSPPPLQVRGTEYSEDYEAHAPQTLDILVRSHDGFSRDLISYAQCVPKLCIRVDGPYGSTLLQQRLLAADNCVFIAGGTGIAVISPLLQTTMHMRRGLPDPERHAIIWYVKDEQHRSWAPGLAVHNIRSSNLGIFEPPPTKDSQRFPLHTLVDNALNYRHALPTPPKLRTTVLGSSQRRPRSVCVVVSGPDEMVHEVRHVCSDLLYKGLDLNLHVEKFGW